MCLSGHTVGEHRDNALAAQRHDGNDLVVVARVDGDVVAAQLADLGNTADVAGSFLDGYDVLDSRKPLDGLQTDVGSGAGGYVVQNDRQSDRISNSLVVSVQTFLRSLREVSEGL